MPRDIAGQRVASREFIRSVGVYMDEAGKEPVIITKHNRDARVLMDVAEYERLKRKDTRKAFRAADMPDEHLDMIEEADYGPVDPKLEALMDD